MSDESRLAELRKKWPMMKNTHPRQKNSPDWNTWRNFNAEIFMRRMDKDLFNSWREFQSHYNASRIEQLLDIVKKDERYAEHQPIAYKVILDILEFKTPLHTYDEMIKRIRDIRRMFPTPYSPVYRGIDVQVRSTGEEE